MNCFENSRETLYELRQLLHCSPGGETVKLILGIIALSIGLTSSAVERASMTATAKIATQPCTFFPPNKLRFPIRPSGQMPELTFRRIIQTVGEVYAPLFRQAGHPPLFISPRWTDDEMNAFALICNQPELVGTPKYPPECAKMRTSAGVNTPFSLVAMFGGLARHPMMTVEGFVLVACHEIGHHLGGFPEYEKNTSWASTEGQADYFATAKCARNVFRAVGNNAALAEKANVPFEIRRTCMASFPTSAEDAAICMRSAMGGLTLARVLGSLGSSDPAKINFNVPDKNVVSATFEGHPEAQCRLDTYFAGSVCQIPASQAFGPKDSRTGACTASRQENKGARPACWFSESKI